MNQLKNKLETSNKSVFIAKQQIQKLEETRKVSVETWNQKYVFVSLHFVIICLFGFCNDFALNASLLRLQQEGVEICELQKMIQSEKQALDNLTEVNIHSYGCFVSIVNY